VLVGGEAGIGKTALLRALHERVRERVTFAGGACEPLSVPAPLAPVRELAEAVGAGDLPELRRGDRPALARALVDALESAGPVLAALEDAHWADPATLDVVRLLSRRVEGRPIALVVSYRDDEVAANQELERLLGDLATSPTTERLNVPPLSAAAVRRLAGSAGLDAEALVDVSGGNPFLVVESIAAGGGLPVSVREATLARAGRLGAAARAAVEAASVIGRRVEPALLEAMAPGSGKAIESALARGVIVADGASLAFRHELIREAIASSLPPPRRASLHAAALAALERRGSGDNARLAHHAELAGLGPRAARHARRAAQDAARIGALREVWLQSRRALRLDPTIPAGERCDLLIQLARAANFASTRPEEALRPAEDAVALAARLADPVREGRALGALASALWSLDRLGAARDAAQLAVAALEGASDAAELARAHATHLRMEATAFDPRIAVEAGPRALRLAAGSGLKETRLDVAISVALARGHTGDGDALPALERSLAVARKAGLAFPTVRCCVNLVFVASLLRRHASADEHAREAWGLLEGHQTPIPGNVVALFRARSLLDRGRWDDALAVVGRPGRHWAGETPVARVIEGTVRARRGEAGAGRLIAEAGEELRDLPEGSRHEMVRVALMETAWLEGDLSAAARHLRAARESPAAGRFARPAAELALWARRCGLRFEAPPHPPEPVRLELDGDWRRAVAAWHEAEAPYEAALAALPGDDRAARTALATLGALGARGAARALARARAAAGVRVPRGPRRSTRSHPAGLTRREQEVLERLATGATNASIADTLHLSERTVAHHVSAILAKLGAANRLVAVERARNRGLLAQDGPHPAPS